MPTNNRNIVTVADDHSLQTAALAYTGRNTTACVYGAAYQIPPSTMPSMLNGAFFGPANSYQIHPASALSQHGYKTIYTIPASNLGPAVDSNCNYMKVQTGPTGPCLSTATPPNIDSGGSLEDSSTAPMLMQRKRSSSKEPILINQRVAVQPEQIVASLGSLAVVGITAAVVAILSLQLLIALSKGYPDSNLRWKSIVHDVASSIASITLCFSMVSVFASCLQLFFCLKVLKLAPQSRIRIVLYLRQVMYLRFLSFGGLFVSIPLLLIGTVSFVHLYTGYAATVASALVTLLSLVICVGFLLHAISSWLCGVLKLSDHELDAGRNMQDLCNKRSLSTLV